MDLVRPGIPSLCGVDVVTRGPRIKGLRILPPLAIGRLGAASTPMDNYRVEVDPEHPLGFRRLIPDTTLKVDPATGTLATVMPDALKFTEDRKVRPVAPFLEVMAEVRGGELVPLTEGLLAANGLSTSDVSWCVHVGNHKVYRRTKHVDDKIESYTGWFSDHQDHQLDYDSRQRDGRQCKNFWRGARLALGSVRYIAPNREFPEIRLRFTPAAGYVYGSSTAAPQRNSRPSDANLRAIVYAAARSSRTQPGKSHWLDFQEPDSGRASAETTQPGSIFANRSVGNAVLSRGYVDDECDGLVHVQLTVGGQALSAYARIGAGPPAYAPDSFPVRSVADELEQALQGPEVTDQQVRDLGLSRDDLLVAAEEILRRAFGTIRLMNTTAMNGNPSPSGFGNNMAIQDNGDTNRALEPIMAQALVDPGSLETLHQHVLAALRSGSAPWFVDVLRKHDEIGDLSTKGRRKMPALMRGADGRHLALTSRQVDLIRRVARGDIFADTTAASASPKGKK
jgi:hypothetical protein